MTSSTLHPWRALFWEPVNGTGERLMVGVLYQFDGAMQATRILRDDVLDSLYGHASAAARKLIDTALEMYVQAARVSSIEAASMPLTSRSSKELLTGQVA